MSAAARHVPKPETVRCAIYTRKSTEEGLDQEFNSLMAQRESAEAYIRSQREQGWVVVSDQYSDGGFSGGNMERPGLKRLLADVEAKRIDCVVVYKVDRLSRSLLDFAAIIGLLDKYNVSFVSVTQQFNTNTSLGRLTLNILLSFAQFEREIISERTRDKIFAARRKGKWTGGLPVLGYDVDIRGGKLNINEEEAERVREIFAIYLRERSIVQTLYEVERRGWRMKSWITRDGGTYGGNRFTKQTLRHLLSNPLYIGRVRLKGEVHSGEHEPILDRGTWEKVNELLALTSRGRRPKARTPQNAPLRGLLYCAGCGTLMTPSYTKRGGGQVRYYICTSAQRRGSKTCHTRSIAAELIEQAVAEKLKEATGLENLTLDDLSRRVEKITFERRAREVVVVLRPTLSSHKGRSLSFPVRVRTRPKKFRPRPIERTPRITRLMALAIRLETLVENGTVKDYADLARLGRVSRARISQIMNLLNLAPDIQEKLLFLPHVRSWRDTVSERVCRPVVEEVSWAEQRRMFGRLLGEGT